MRVFVTGGTGALGTEAVKALVAAGHDVTGLSRSPEKSRWLSEHGVRPCEASLWDVDGLIRAFADNEAVINLATSLPPTNKFFFASAWKENQRIRTVGSSNVVKAAQAAGVQRLIQESVAMLYQDGGDGWIGEDHPTDRFPIAVGNHAAEANAQAFTDSGGEGVTLRLGLFYGPGAAHSVEFYRLAKRHICVSIGHPDSYLSSIHVADGGRAVCEALAVPAGTYNIVDDEPLTKRDFADALATAAGAKPWIRGPGRLARILGNRTTSLTRSLRVSNRAFRASTGWTPRYPSAREGWFATAAAIDASLG